ncbi:MAG: hypothetical protein GY711_16795 [bacterium]|nr:hypothetical protein [bacterium]
MSPARSPARWKRRLAFVLLAALAADQILLYTVLRDDRLAGLAIAPFDPPVFAQNQARRIAELERIRDERPARAASVFDADLGWCPTPGPADPPYHYDELAARVTEPPFPRAPEAGTKRIAVFGCSFTRGDEVEGHEAWPALLHARPGLVCANFGMGGYGADQAFLRFRRDAAALELDEVWLGWMPASAQRVVTHYPPLLNHWTNAVAFKPRFVLDGAGELKLLPAPASDVDGFLRLFGDQEALLDAIGAADHWIARAPRAYAPRGSSWTHHFATTRMLLTWHERQGRDPMAPIADPASEVHRLHDALVRRMHDEAEEHGLRFRLLVLPAHPDLEQASAGYAYWAALVTSLRSDGIEVLDLAPHLEEAGARQDPSFWMGGGHYAPKANALVAETIAEAWLR